MHYARSVGEFQAWFRSDADCLDYLEWLRWPDGFACPGCGHAEGWQLGDGRFMCSGCGGRTSVTAGTIFDRTRTPLKPLQVVQAVRVGPEPGLEIAHGPRKVRPSARVIHYLSLHRSSG